MRKNRSQNKNTVKQQKIIYKGIYISNERRKGPGGRIKSDQFQCKIQVMDMDSALHQSQVQWVQIRRYVRGQKRQKNDKFNKKDSKSNNYNKNENNKDIKQKTTNNQKLKDKNYKQKDLNREKDYPSLTVEKKQSNNIQKQAYTNLVRKFKQKKLETPEITIQTKQQTQIKTINKSNETGSNNQKFSQQLTFSQNENYVINNQSVKKKQFVKELNLHQRQINDEVQTQSQIEDQTQLKQQNGVQAASIVQNKNETIILQKIKVQQKSQNKNNDQKRQQKPSEQTKQVQQVIVARVISQTKIVFKDKKFVGILTCQKRKSTKNSFIQKDIKPIQKIIQDYFLDVSPIHSRLPKMELDNLVAQNLNVLTDYIQKIYPQKGKQLTKKKLNQILDVIESIYVVASFGLWQKNKPYANIHQVIGKTMTIDGQCNCFLFQHQLNDFHYDQVEQQKENKKVLEICPTQLHTKYDKMVFSIDPATSVDLDDALSIQKINQNTFQIGIHISDVSQYLKFIERSELIKRTTSVYLPHKCFHMLTTDLMKISSLNPNVQRLAFSIFVKMNIEGQLIGESRLQKNIVKSNFKLSYQTVQDIITAKINYQKFLLKHPNTQLQQFQVLIEKLHDLTKIGLAHRSKRIKFQVFQNREISYQLDQNKWPIDISVQSRYTSKKIVQEYMILGNVEAAKFLIKNFKDNALIIFHPKPSDLAVKSFNETFKFLNRKFQFQDIHQVQSTFLQIQNDKTINQEVKQFLYFKGRRVQQTAGYKFYHQAVNQILQKSQKKDPALIKNVHFALGEDFYTHFTSPMRRMADILVHQTLSSLLYKTVPNKISVQQIEKINLGRKHTKRLKKDLTQIYMCLMIHKTGRKIQQDGIITSFGLKSVSIYIPYFDMMKEIIWRDQLDLSKVSKNRQNQDILDVCIYYDRRFPSRDIMWKVKKYDKIKLIIDCTKRPPLRLSISLEVISTKGNTQRIDAYNPDL